MPEYEAELKLPDSDEIFAWITRICRTPHRRPGTPEGHEAEQWVAKKLKEFELENVTMDPIPITVWNAVRWSLKVDDWEIPSFFVVNTGFTSTQGVTAPLVYVGTGTWKDFKKVDVAEKIVVADVPFPYMPTGVLVKLLQVLGASYCISDPDHSLTLRAGQYLNFVRQNFIGGATSDTAPPSDVYWQAYKRGAKAICLILRDQPSNSNSHFGPYDGLMKPMPGLWIGKYDGMELRKKAKAGTTATVLLEGTTIPGTMHNVWGVLPGMSDEVVLVTSHHDSPFKGATEDGAGVAQVFAQIKAWSSVPKEKRARTLVFVVDAGHFYGSEGGSAFARDHADLMKRVKILVTLEHLGAKEVVEKERSYVETDHLALTVMFTSNDPLSLATVVNALKKKPAKRTIPIPATLFAPAPTSDAAGYVLEAGVPVISWIGCPYYLLDAHDTLDKVAKDELRPIAETVTELIKPFMCSG
ncbi:MAG: M28 family peptidase [Candidatus Helarchaeota archaeon]|nr:M28 family peptidase [Candidatus Helarchaeota archaeon]